LADFSSRSFGLQEVRMQEEPGAGIRNPESPLRLPASAPVLPPPFEIALIRAPFMRPAPECAKDF
jgi:hypothetical protein